MTLSLKKRIVITGVSRGLGLALTEAFAEMGHVVAGCCRRRESVNALSLRFPDPHHFAAVNVADYEQVRAWANLVLEQMESPDLLLNNAAIMNASAPLWKAPPEEFSQVIDVNIKGVFHVLRCFVPAMIQRGKGVIVNFSSGWGRSTSPNVAPYCATKWAVEGLTRALADELPHGMAAIPLNPGIINTEMLQSCFGQDAAAYPTAREWARSAAPFLLDLGPEDNGDPLTAPA